MPDTVYMDVDWRRDHSMSIPRPQLSIDLNVPNACTKCHLNDFIAGAPGNAASRAAAGRTDDPTYSEWILKAANGDDDAKKLLVQYLQTRQGPSRSEVSSSDPTRAAS